MKKKLLPSEYFASYGAVHVRCLSVDQHGQILETNHEIIDLPVVDNALREAREQHAAAVDVFGTGGVLCSVAFVSDMEETALAVTTDAITDALRAAVRGVSSAVAVMQ